MPWYRCITECHHSGRLYTQNKYAEFDEDPGSYFELVDVEELPKQRVNVSAIRRLDGKVTLDPYKTMTHDSIDFTTMPDCDSATGRLRWNEDDGTLEVGLRGGEAVLQIGQEMTIPVEATVAVSNGQAVWVDGATNGTPTVDLADADTYPEAISIGIATEDIGEGASGYVTTTGFVRGVDTSSFSPGDILWLGSTPGEVTNIPPTKPSFWVVMGICITSDATDGTIYCNVDVLPRLDSLTNVNTSGKATGSILVWSGSLWEDSAGAGVSPELSSTSWVYLGDQSTNGSWRIGRDGNNLVHQRRESDTWVTKNTITP